MILKSWANCYIQCNEIHTARKYQMRNGSMQRFVIVSNRLLTIYHFECINSRREKFARRRVINIVDVDVFIDIIVEPVRYINIIGKIVALRLLEVNPLSSAKTVFFLSIPMHEYSAFKSLCLKILVYTVQVNVCIWYVCTLNRLCKCDSFEHGTRAHPHRLYFAPCLEKAQCSLVTVMVRWLRLQRFDGICISCLYIVYWMTKECKE